MGGLGAASPPRALRKGHCGRSRTPCEGSSRRAGSWQVTALGAPWRAVPGAQLTWVGWALVVTQRALLAAAVVKSRGQMDLSGCSVYPMNMGPRSRGLCSLSGAPVTHGQEPLMLLVWNETAPVFVGWRLRDSERTPGGDESSVGGTQFRAAWHTSVFENQASV